jgi:hypothetical protein
MWGLICGDTMAETCARKGASLRHGFYRALTFCYDQRRKKALNKAERMIFDEIGRSARRSNECKNPSSKLRHRASARW